MVDVHLSAADLLRGQAVATAPDASRPVNGKAEPSAMVGCGRNLAPQRIGDTVHSGGLALR